MDNFFSLPVFYRPVALSLSSPSETSEGASRSFKASLHSRANKLESLGLGPIISPF